MTKKREALLTVEDTIHQFQNGVVNVFIYQTRKAVLCALQQLLKAVYNGDNVQGG